MASLLTHLFKLSLKTNEIPSVWKSVFVLPLFKGGDRVDMNNYRLIIKMSVLAKVFESLVRDRLKEYLLVNNILSEYQSIFKKGHSTIRAALKVINDKQ